MKKKIVALLLAVSLVAAMAINAAAAGPEAAKRLSGPGDESLPPIPSVTVRGNMVTEAGEETGYLELSLYVTARAFQTVGVTLSYDTTVLTPVMWDAAGSPIEVTDSETWLTTVPTKGTDGVQGKPAMARAGGEDAPGRAYLYLGASAFDYTALNDERVVTVRFQVKANGTGYANVTLGEDGGAAPFTVQFAPEEVAEESLADGRLLSTAGLWNEETNEWDLTAYAYGDEQPDGKPYTAAFDKVAESGVTQGGTVEPVPGGDYAITFFDWDGRVIDAISAGGETDGAATKVTAEQLALIESIESGIANSKLGYEFENWLVVYQANDGSGLQTVNGSLTARKAHDDSAKPDTKDVVDFETANLDHLSTAYIHQNSGVKNSEAGGYFSVLVQAQYKTTDDVNGGWHDASGNKVPNPADTTGLQRGEDYDLSMPDSYYTIGEPTFYQSGSTDGKTGYYIITCSLERGVALRSNELAIKGTIVMINQDEQEENVVVRVDPELTDHSEFQIVVPRSATKVYYQALETYQRPGWTASPIRSAESAQIPIATVIERGALALLLSEAEAAYGKYTDGMTADDMKTIWSSDVNAVCFSDAKYSGVTNENLYTMELRIMKWMKANGKTTVTQSELDTALSYTG